MKIEFSYTTFSGLFFAEPSARPAVDAWDVSPGTVPDVAGQQSRCMFNDTKKDTGRPQDGRPAITTKCLLYKNRRYVISHNLLRI